MIRIESVHIEELRGIRKLGLSLDQKTFAVSGPNGYFQTAILLGTSVSGRVEADVAFQYPTVAERESFAAEAARDAGSLAARIAAAGIQRPANWSDLGSSARDAWEERQVRSLDRAARRSAALAEQDAIRRERWAEGGADAAERRVRP